MGGVGLGSVLRCVRHHCAFLGRERSWGKTIILKAKTKKSRCAVGHKGPVFLMTAKPSDS